ncbi:MAG: DUF1295 domain-containing protein [Leptospirales bacterium]|nr:DUF1295 domain-containing protein [Leptospirales bacterium]
MKQKHIIDTFKGLTGPVVLCLIFAFHRQESITAWVYLALHGTYGILWILKSQIFGDKQWEQPVTLIRGGMLVSGLSLYWISPLVITYYGVQAHPIQIAVAVAMFGFGVFFHFASDLQKHISLKLQPGLITTGLFSRTRNPNYFGELLIYTSFALLPIQGFSWWVGFLPAVAFASIIAVEWIPNILRKERSLSRYPEFAAYKKRSALLIPFLF